MTPLLVEEGILVARGRYADALVAFETCLSLRRATLPSDHWLISTTLSFVGECLYRLGETERGVGLLSVSYESLRDTLGPKHEQTREARQRLLAADAV